MSNTSTVSVWTKENCLEAVSVCASKEEVAEKFPDAAASIKEKKWFYMYGDKHLGTNLGESEPDFISETKATPESSYNPLELNAMNQATQEPPKTPAAQAPKKRQAKVYKLIKYQPLSFTLNVGRNMNLRIYDEKSGSERAIRHCPNSRTLFVDKQNPNVAVVEPIVFLKGFFETNERMGYTQDFLDIHPKKGVVFEEVNNEMDARVQVDMEDMIIDIKSAIREKMKTEGGIENVRAIVSVLNADVVGAAKMTPSEIRYAAYECVDTNPNRFVNNRGDVTIFDDPAIKRTAIAQHAFISGIIQVSPNGRQVVWADSKKAICSIPIGLSYLKVFTDFLQSDEGIAVAQEISRR